MPSLDLNISTILFAAKEAGATCVRITPDGVIDVLFEHAVQHSGRRFRKMGGVHEVKRTDPDGREVTYWYAYRGGPRISEEEARRIMGAARNKIVPFTKPAP